MEDYVPAYTSEIVHRLAEEFTTATSEVTYVDHAGTTLYAKSQIDSIHADLSSTLYANPHSQSTVSRSTADMVDHVRYQLLNFFGTSPEEYSVIFTSGSTAALKLVGESFDYGVNGELVFLDVNHTSAVGMRTYAARHRCLRHEDAFEVLASSPSQPFPSASSDSNSLFVYPAQCNFSGFKYPLQWIQNCRRGCLGSVGQRWFCMLDTAAFAATNPLDLHRHQPDFACVSFYKLFGYPTGLGALLVRNSSAHVLRKRYFGGGSVAMVLIDEDHVEHRYDLQERFHDGSMSFLAIVSLRHGLDAFRRFRLDMHSVSEHVFRLAKWMYDHLKVIRHFNGAPMVTLYHDSNFESHHQQGGILNFNVKRSDGRYIGCTEVLHMANLYNISLRTGCFCNPGACQRHLRLTSVEVKRNFALGHTCGDPMDLIAGKPNGSVRVSFGYMSSLADAVAVITMLTKCFVEVTPSTKLPPLQNQLTNTVHTHKISLTSIYIYPVKSCAAFPVRGSWNLNKTGLLYDREWMIMTRNGVALTQKHAPRMCRIRPRVDLVADVLVLQYEGVNDVVVGLSREVTKKEKVPCHSKVCGDKVDGWDCGDEVGEWLDSVLERSGLRLLRRVARVGKRDAGECNLTLANKAQFLLINRASIEWLYDRMPEEDRSGTILDIAARFRPNLLVDFGQAFAENHLQSLHIDNIKFIAKGQCTRCQMICIDQRTGNKSKEPLATISREFQGKIFFGVYLERSETELDGDVEGLHIHPSMETSALLR